MNNNDYLVVLFVYTSRCFRTLRVSCVSRRFVQLPESFHVFCTSNWCRHGNLEGNEASHGRSWGLTVQGKMPLYIFLAIDGSKGFLELREGSMYFTGYMTRGHSIFQPRCFSLNLRRGFFLLHQNFRPCSKILSRHSSFDRIHDI